MKEDPNSAEAQISFGYLTRTLGIFTILLELLWIVGKSYRSKALQMAFSACQINQYSNRPKTQALLLKTGILVDMGNFFRKKRVHKVLDKGEEASKTISEAIKFDPHNFDFQRALVNSYLSKSKIREARTWLSNITIARPNEPRVQVYCLLINNSLNCRYFVPRYCWNPEHRSEEMWVPSKIGNESYL